MPKSSKLLAGAALAVFYGAGAWYVGERISDMPFVASVEASAPVQEAPLPVVDVVAADARSITEWDEFTGRFEAVDEVAIRARVSGYLDDVHFKPGDIVEKGDLLFTIDARPFETALAEAEDLLILLGLEDGTGPKIDAVSLLLQLRRELEARLVA